MIDVTRIETSLTNFEQKFNQALSGLQADFDRALLCHDWPAAERAERRLDAIVAAVGQPANDVAAIAGRIRQLKAQAESTNDVNEARTALREAVELVNQLKELEGLNRE